MSDKQIPKSYVLRDMNLGDAATRNLVYRHSLLDFARARHLAIRNDIESNDQEIEQRRKDVETARRVLCDKIRRGGELRSELYEAAKVVVALGGETR